MSPNRWTMLAVIIGSGIVFLDGTIVNVALPRIGRELPASLVGVLEGQTYVNAGYLAVLSALLIVSGALNDYYGRRRMFAIGLTGFGITSLPCGIAPNLELLSLFRLLQGAAGAILVPGSRNAMRHESVSTSVSSPASSPLCRRPSRRLHRRARNPSASGRRRSACSGAT